MLTKLLGPSQTDVVRDAVLLVARVILGVALLKHGLQKFDAGIGATGDMFSQMGIPAGDLAALFAIGAETIGGALLILGLLSPLAGLWVAADLAGAIWYVHQGHGFFVTDGGWELAGVYAAAAIALGAVPGRFSLDFLLAGRRRTALEAA